MHSDRLSNPGTTRLTARSIAAIIPNGRDFDVRDTALNGFHVRVTKAGRKIFRYQYRRNDRSRPVLTLGETSAFTIDQARDWASRLALDVANGKDPSAEKAAWKEAPTLHDAWERYRADRLPSRKPRTQTEYLKYWRKHLGPRLGSLKLAKITRGEVTNLHHQLGATRTTANRVVALLSTILTYCVEQELIAANVAKGVRKFREHRREDVFSPAELARISRAISAEREPWVRAAMTLLIVSGARHSEVLEAEWADFHLHDGQTSWIIPADRFKGNRSHAYALDLETAEMLQRYRSEATVISPRWLFPNPSGQGPRVTLRGPWERIRKAACVEGKVLHTFRHTFITGLANQGASAIDLMNIAGHSSVATSMRYVQAADRNRLASLAHTNQAAIRAAMASHSG